MENDTLHEYVRWSKTENVPKHIRGEKSRKNTANWGKLVSIIGAYAPKKERNLVSTRESVPCWHAISVTNAPPADGNHSKFGKGQARCEGQKIEKLIFKLQFYERGFYLPLIY